MYSKIDFNTSNYSLDIIFSIIRVLTRIITYSYEFSPNLNVLYLFFSQAFCRLAAVFGATYFLGRPLDGVVVDAEGTAVGVAFNGKKISCKHLVADSRLFPHNRKHVKKQWKISRKICLLEDSVMPTEKEQLTFVSLPPVNAKGNIKVHSVDKRIKNTHLPKRAHSSRFGTFDCSGVLLPVNVFQFLGSSLLRMTHRRLSLLM